MSGRRAASPVARLQYGSSNSIGVQTEQPYVLVPWWIQRRVRNIEMEPPPPIEDVPVILLVPAVVGPLPQEALTRPDAEQWTVGKTGQWIHLDRPDRFLAAIHALLEHMQTGQHESGSYPGAESAMNQVADECIALIARQKGIAPEQIRLDSSFEELALDSLDRVSIAFDLEEKYDIEIPESKLDEIKTVRDMVNGIEDAMRQNSAEPSAPS